MARVQRMIGIVVCGGLLLIPQVVCFVGAPPNMMKVADFIRLCFPLTFYVLVNLCIDEGRARERERAVQEKPH
jgi:hypothetical protein